MLAGIVSRNEAIAWNVIEGKAVLLDRDEGRAIILNEVGSYIWLSLDKPLPLEGTGRAIPLDKSLPVRMGRTIPLDKKTAVEDIIALVRENFDSGKEPLEKDIRSFLDELLRRDLIRIHEE